MIYAIVAAGFLLLFLGCESVLRATVGLSKALGAPAILIGLFIVTLAMSAPEFAVALEAVRRGVPEIALGDLIGSTIAITLVVFGLGALAGSLPAPPIVVFRDGGALITAGIVVVFVLMGGTVGRPAGLVLLGLWAFYIGLAFATDLRRPPRLAVPDAGAGERSRGLGIFFFAFGLVCLIFGAHFVLDGGLVIAHTFCFRPTAVALTLVALATALPKLVVTLRSSSRGQTAVASSRLFASGIFNLLLVLGVTGVVHPFAVAPVLADVDAPLMVGAALLLFVLLFSGWRLTKGQGTFLVACYLAYLSLVILRSALRWGI